MPKRNESDSPSGEEGGAKQNSDSESSVAFRRMGFVDRARIRPDLQIFSYTKATE
jgi:hypothetical protein